MATVTNQPALRRLSAHASPLALIAAAALGAGAAPVFAQDDETGVDTIVVTSRYREEDVQSTPIAITAISGEDLEIRSIANVEDLGAVIPNAFFRENVGNFGPTSTIGLRGITQQDFSYAFEPAVALYIDDVYHGTLTGSDMDLIDLERVEVLRGPQGTLYGKNSIGGNIRLISRQPEGDESGEITVTAGDYDRLEVRGVYDFALVEDRLFARVSGASKRKDGYGSSLDFTCEMIRRGTPELAGIGDGLGADGPDADDLPDPVPVGSEADNDFSLPAAFDPRGSCEIVDLGATQSDSGRLMLRLLATSDLELNVAVDALRSTATPLPQPLMTPLGGAANVRYDDGVIFPTYGVRFTADDRFVTGDPYTNYSTFADPLEGQRYDPTTRTDAWGASATADYVFGDMSLKLIGAYRTYEVTWHSDTDLTPFPIQQTDYIQEHEQTQLEARLNGALLNDRLEWTTGVFYYDSTSRAYNTTEFGAFNNDFELGLPGGLQNFVADDYYTTETASVFGHAILDVTDRLSLSGGLRYTEEEKGNIFDHQPGLGRAEATFTDERVDWKVSADLQLTDDVFLYGQAATGFRSAGFNPRIFTIGQLKAIDPEEALTYEVGLKLDLLDNTLRLNSAVYYTEYDPRLISQFGLVVQCDAPNELNPTPYMLGGGTCPEGTALAGANGIPWFFYTNVPGELQGFETEGSWVPVDNLAVDFSLGWNEYSGEDRHETALLQPEWTASAGVQYEIPLGDGSRALTPRLDWSYQSHRTNGPANVENFCPERCIDEYSLVNARLSYEDFDSGWTISLAATNLTDELYWQQLGSEITAAGGLAAGRTGVPGRPREVFLTATKRF